MRAHRLRRHRPWTAATLLILIILSGGLARGLQAQPLEILFTADTEGQLAPRADVDGKESGGLARRAAIVTAARREAPGLILLDGGNALFGGDSTESAGKGVAVAYDALGYHALNISYRDFRLGKEATLAALKEVKLAVLSANVLDAGTGAPLFKPFVALQAGGERITILGATESPASLEFLPHLKEQLTGIRIEPPDEAIAKHLPQAKTESAGVVLLYYGSASGLRPILARHGLNLKAVLAGGSPPELLPSSPKPPVAGTGRMGGEVLRMSLTGADAKGALRRIAVDSAVVSDPAMEKLVAPFVMARKDPLAAAELPAEAGAGLPPALEPGQTYRLDLQAANRGARLTVLTAALVGKYAGAEAGPGRSLLLLDTEWENIIPLTVIAEEKVPTEYRIPNLADHLYLIVDASRVERLRPDAGNLAGHVPVVAFTLKRIGSKLRGNVLFEVTAGPRDALEIRYYDYAHGHMTLRLSSPPKGGTPAAKPLGPLQRNEVVEAGVFGLDRKKQLDEETAPAGLEFLIVDLRARSLFTLDADAGAFDPKAGKGARLKVGTVADWKEARRHLQLVADGEYGYSPLPLSRLPEEPRFLPDILTGGEVVFLAPQSSRSLELRCDFPNAKPPDGPVFHPTGFKIPLAGKPPALAERKPIVSIVDDVFQVAVVGQGAAETFASERAGEGSVFLVLDVSVRNTGKKGESFQTKEQLQHVSEKGEKTAIDEVTFRGIHHPAALHWIPPGERRTFQVVYRIPLAEKRPRLGYTGVSLARVLDLEPLEGKAVASAVESPPPAPVAPREEADAKETSPQPGAVKKDDKKEEKKANVRRRPPARKAADPPARVTARQEREPKGLPGVGLTAEQVNQAIDRGTEFLWKYLKPELDTGRQLGSRDGYDVLPCLALVHSGAHRRFPEFDAVLQAYLARVDPVRDITGTYDMGLFCMLVEAYGDPRFIPKLRRAARWLLETQGPLGAWAYGKRPAPECLGDPAENRILQIQGGSPLDGSKEVPWTRTCKWETGEDGDNSTSQYALLGLHAASRSGVKIGPETWQRALSAHEERQCKDGGWCYHSAGSSSYGSMTCAGICARAIARHELGEKSPAEDEGIERGLAWLSANFSVEKNPPNYEWFYYYIYSVERVGRILDTEFIGEHEWYPLGARRLLSAQKPDGSWIGSGTEEYPNVGTSFALLFLTRATATLAEPKRGGDGTLKTGVAFAPGDQYYFILDASGSMLAEMGGRRKFDIARDAVASLIQALPDSAQVALRVYGHRKLAIEKGASDDTALEIPMRPLVKKDFLAKLGGLRARGKTPLARSLLEAKGDLSGAKEDAPVTVVFLTDGGEDTLPRQNPLKAAEEFGKLKGIVLHVVGFDINREDWSQQLLEMTRLAGGQYWPASEAATLNRELQAAVFGLPEGFSVRDAEGRQVAAGAFGDSKTLKEGKYLFSTAYGGEEFKEDLWINTESTTSVTFNAATVTSSKRSGVASRPPAGAPASRPPAGAPASRPAEAPSAKPAPQPPPAVKKFCTACGKPLQPEQRFCVSCGAKVKG